LIFLPAKLNGQFAGETEVRFERDCPEHGGHRE